MNKLSRDTLLGLILVFVVLGGIYFYFKTDSQTADSGPLDEAAMMRDAETERMMMDLGASEDVARKETDSAMMETMSGAAYQYLGDLVDVTNGEAVDGFVTGGTAAGTAQAIFTPEEGYMLFATFSGLPELTDGFFYEGWIARRGDNFDVISTGPLEVIDGVYTNAYSSGTDLTDHDFYVLTLEPDDGDPAPAGHIVEGVMNQL